jgi:DNA-binding NarL/FixJ family response regulator
MQKQPTNRQRSTSSAHAEITASASGQPIIPQARNGGTRRVHSLETLTKPRLLVVHGLPLVRFGLAKLVEASRRFTVCGKTGDAPAARALFVRDQPQVVILGLTLSGGDGIELIKDFRKLNSAARTVVFSSRHDLLSIKRAFCAGAQGYLLASESTAEVLDALNHICAGHFYASKAALRQIVENGTAEGDRPELEQLSDRELQVLSLIGRGFGASRLAHELHLSVKTIETYQMHLKEKLGLRSASELSTTASEWMAKSARHNLQTRNRIIRRKGQSQLSFLYSC